MTDKFNDNEEVIDLGDIVNFFKRNISLILKLASIGAVVGVASSLLVKRTWRGEFQIVLDQGGSTSSSLVQSLANDPRVSGFASKVGLNSKNKKLETEVEILRSPSVLLPIYSYVKEKKEGSKKPFGKSYNEWFNSSISVNLKKGTSVLNFIYKDKDKDLIIPTLEEISNKYQLYSSEERNKNIDRGLIYLDEQVEKYKKISTNSISEALNFAYLHNLVSETDKSYELPLISSEGVRIKAVNKLNLVEKQLAQIDKIPKDSEFIFALAQKINIDNKIKETENSPITKFKQLENELNLKRTIFKESDPLIRSLLKGRNTLISLIRKELINNLNAEKEQLISYIEANKKPIEIITNYVRLMVQASEDSKILMGLKANQNTLTLKRAETKEPWKLITKPTLDDYPFAPNRKIMTLIWLIVGISAGILISYIKEKTSGTIFSKTKMKKLFNVPFIEELNLRNKEQTSEIINLLSSSKLKTSKNETIAIIPIGNIEKLMIEVFLDNLKNFIVNDKIELTTELSKAKLYKSQIFIASLGITKENEIKYFENLLDIQDNKTLGWFLLSNN